MKTSILRISNDILLGKKQDNISQYLLKNCLQIGEIISCVNTCENHPEQITKQLNNSDSDFIIIVGENISSRNANIKKTLANILNDNLVKNDLAESTVKAYYQQSNIPVLYDSKNEFYLPSRAELWPLNLSPLQSFIMSNGSKTFVFIPGELDVAKYVFETYLENIIKQNLTTRYKTTTIKTFGISEKEAGCA
jgi:molybdopterin-biosynthesis enzyme MoeA-like protein